MQLGIHLPQYGRAANPHAISAVANRAEALGFSDVWVSDHIVQPADQGYPSPYLYEPLLTLAWAAAATETIGLGTSVLVVPQYHPLQLANSLASLDALSGGRLSVAVGVGWSEAEFDALDQDFATRGRRMDEALTIMRTAWNDDLASFSGEHYDFADLKVLPKPASRIPIIIGGSGPAAMRRCFEGADGYQGIATSPDDIAPRIAALREQRPDADFVIQYRTGWDPQGMDHGIIRDECVAYAEAGVQHVIAAPWRTTADDWITSMELLVDIVASAT